MKLNLKLIALSMSMLGLISCPTLAAAQAKYKKHQRVESYKDEGGYKGEPIAICPVVDMYTMYMDQMSQNVGRAKPTVGCDQPIQLAGGINFDTLWGNRHMGYMGETSNRFSLNDAYVDVTGNVNEWVKAFIEISYNNLEDEPLPDAGLGPHPLFFTPKPKPGLYSAGYTLERLDLQQGVIVIGNPARMPVFLRLGKQFLDFGRYQIHPITRSMTQVLTETLQTSVELSFITGWNGMGLHGSLFAFENPMSHHDDPFENDELGKTNYGGQIGFGVISDQFGWDVGLGYIYNMTGVNDVAYAVTLFNSGAINGEGTYDDRVGAGTIYGMLNYGPFSLSAHYVSALQHFSSEDLTAPDDEDDAFFFFDDEDGARPWAADITGAYQFNAFDRSQNVYIGYQASGDAVNLYLPMSRWLIGYSVDALKNTNVGFEFSHDQDYSEDDAGTGDGSYRGVLRVAVKFG